MARPVSWLPRLAEIRRSVSNSRRTHYDRAALEQLFQMQTRAAGKLMSMLPQVDALGRSRLVERGALARFLDEINNAEDPSAAYKRTKGKVSRKKPRLLVRKDLITEGRLDNLPASVKLERGHISLKFGSALELMESLAIFAGAVKNDEEEFIERYVLAPPGSAQREKSRQEINDVRVLFEELRQAEANKAKNAN